MNLHDCDIYVKIQTEPTHPRDTRNGKQRSEGWFKVRKQATVTGSSIYDTLGLDGLK